MNSSCTLFNFYFDTGTILFLIHLGTWDIHNYDNHDNRLVRRPSLPMPPPPSPSLLLTPSSLEGKAKHKRTIIIQFTGPRRIIYLHSGDQEGSIDNRIPLNPTTPTCPNRFLSSHAPCRTDMTKKESTIRLRQPCSEPPEQTTQLLIFYYTFISKLQYVVALAVVAGAVLWKVIR